MEVRSTGMAYYWWGESGGIIFKRVSLSLIIMLYVPQGLVCPGSGSQSLAYAIFLTVSSTEVNILP